MIHKDGRVFYAFRDYFMQFHIILSDSECYKIYYDLSFEIQKVVNTMWGRYGLLYCSPFLMAPRILGAKLNFWSKRLEFSYNGPTLNPS